MANPEEQTPRHFIRIVPQGYLTGTTIISDSVGVANQKPPSYERSKIDANTTTKL